MFCRRLVPLLATLYPLLSGCKASVNAESKAIASGSLESEAVLEEDVKPTGKGGELVEDGELTPQASSAQTQVALLGARHDLRLTESQTRANCACLVVAVGEPNSPAFSWRGAAPAIDPNTQLVVAFGSEGVTCAAGADNLPPASYWGYRQSGDDVLVIVERAGPGRPVTHGAIVPKPGPNGKLKVQPAAAGVPYGRGLDGAESCTLGT